MQVERLGGKLTGKVAEQRADIAAQIENRQKGEKVTRADLPFFGRGGRQTAQRQSRHREGDAVDADIGGEQCQPGGRVACREEQPDAGADKRTDEQLADKQQKRGKAEDGKGVSRGLQLVAGFLHFTLHGTPPKQLLRLF